MGKRKKGGDEEETKGGKIHEIIGEVYSKPTDSTTVKAAIDMDMNLKTMLNEMLLVDLEALSDTAKFYAKTGHNDTCLRAMAMHLPVVKGLQANLPIPHIFMNLLHIFMNLLHIFMNVLHIFYEPTSYVIKPYFT